MPVLSILLSSLATPVYFPNLNYLKMNKVSCGIGDFLSFL
jgi:hypothetical protein